MQAHDGVPVFPVQFARVRDEFPKVLDNQAIFEDRAIVRWVPFGYGPILQPGTIWEHQVLRSRWPFNGIVADAEVHPQIPILGAYGKWPIDGFERFVLPKGQVTIDGRASLSRLALFDAKVGNERILLLVPCMEIFRFYYGHSTQLAFRILRGDLVSAPHWMYDADASWVDNEGRARLELAPSLDITNAYTLGRFVLDPVGLRRARAIVTRAMIAEGRSIPIDVLPPFNGPWRVHVRGRWLSYGRTRGYLVYAITRCEATPPFVSLSVHGGFARDGSSGRKPTQDDAPTSTAERRRSVSPKGEVIIEPGDPGLRALNQALPTLDKDDRFPKVPIIHVVRRRRPGKGERSSGSTIVSVPSSTPDVAISDTPADTGPNAGFFTSRRRAQDLREGRDMLALYQEALDQLPGVAASSGFLCTIAREVIELSRAFSGPPPVWVYVDRPSKQSRSVLLATVKFALAQALVIEIQRRPGAVEEIRTLIVADVGFADIDEDRLMRILVRCVMREGHVRNLDGVKLLENIRLSGANHWERDTPQTYAARILGKIVDLIDDIDATALDKS
jgi:hypothetical protein